MASPEPVDVEPVDAELVQTEGDTEDVDDIIWTLYVKHRVGGVRKVQQELAEQYKITMSKSMVHLRIQRRKSIQQVLHLFDISEQRMLTAAVLDMGLSQGHDALADNEPFHKVWPVMLAIIRERNLVLGLHSPVRLSIEDGERHTVQYTYEEVRHLAELEAANDVKFDEIKRRR